MSALSFNFRLMNIQELEKIKELMQSVEWSEHYVGAHVITAQKNIQDADSDVYVATANDEMAGFISFQHHHMNFLTYVNTLVIAKAFQRKGLGKAFIELAEDKAQNRGYRGIFLDTTHNNPEARTFYKAIGFQEAYTMPHYYEDNLHGVTYLKFFNQDIAALNI